jgi:hypothetical protein
MMHASFGARPDASVIALLEVVVTMLSGLEPVQSYRRVTPRNAGYGTVTLVRAYREPGPSQD